MSSLSRFISALFVVVSFVWFCLAVPNLVSASAQPLLPQVVVVSQVRGTECCDVGSVQSLQTQLNLAVATKVPIKFAVRWDALNNPELSSLLFTAQQQHPDLVELGILIEITPGLARAAGVTYSGTPADWYQAQHVFTLGYAQTDREKIVDRLVEQFEIVFSQSPQFSVGWMIDTPTLQYLHDRHGVILHEITREQWATDSYHLYGGPAHYPFPASPNWAFIPSEGSLQTMPVMIRQTVTDPLYNYGDSSNAFTSQPNDFTLDNKPFEYFQRLLDQALGLDGTTQLPRGWAVLGLETSMSEYYQQLFVRQIEYVASLHQSGMVELPTVNQVVEDWKQANLNMYQGSDSTLSSKLEEQQSWWITSSSYRVRIRQRGTELFIDDIRVYSSELQDYYASTQAENHGFWIAPYILDGSLWYEQSIPTRTWWQKLLLPPEVPDFAPAPLADLSSSPSRINLPAVSQVSNPTVDRVGEDLLLSYESRENGAVVLEFKDKSWGLKWKSGPFFPTPLLLGTTPVQLESDHRQRAELSWKIADKTSHSLAINCKPIDQLCDFTTSLRPELLLEIQHNQYPFMLPESKVRKLSASKTLLYAHNQYALAGRNPARLVVVPYDELGYPSVLAAEPEISTSPNEVVAELVSAGKGEKIQFIDVQSETAQAVTVTISLSDTISKTTTVYFAPNCFQSWQDCLMQPRHGWWFIQTMVKDKFRAMILKESQ